MELPKSGFFSTVFSALLRPVIRRLDAHSCPKYSGSLTLAGLRETVKIFFDPHAIPHVKAANESDLFFAQGYLHAQERLWQMEMNRRFLCGRMAEMFGNFPLPWRELSSQFRGQSTSDFDYFVRLLGIRSAAEASLRLLSEADHQRLRCYSDGINRYIEQCGKRLPWEFRLLRHQPELWRPEDTLTIIKGLAFLLSTALYSRLNLIALAAKLKHEPDKLRSLIPGYPNDGPTISQAIWDQGRSLWQFTNDVLGATDWNPAGHGSNNWVIAPSRSETGSAILCNDPHLRMTLPSLWYLMHLAADSNTDGGYEAWGASIPGCPFIQIGHNRQIAWGITAALCDDVELYREKIHPVEPDRYLAGHQWRKIERRTEPVRLRRGAVIEKTVRSTHHGPIISDFPTPANAREVLAVQWTAHQASREFHSIYRVNQARTWKDFLDGLSHHSAPSLNFVYADRAGNIGYALAGNIPLRTKSPSLMPVEGWDQRNEWRGYIPFDELPRLYNPPSGTIATANNKITGARYPYYLSHFFEPAHRIRRINQLLSMRQKFTAADMAKIQQDEISLHAVDLIAALKPDLGKVPDDDALAKNAAAKLLAWDGNCTENSVEAAIFHVFHHRLLANLLIPDLGEDLFTSFTEILNLCIFPTDEILKNFRSRWFTQRSRRELVALSLCQACAELREALGENIGAWHWGKVHRLRLNHSLSRISLLRPLLSIGPIPTGGDGMTVNLGFYRHSNPYIETVGASLRCIIALGESVSSAFILPSGQSAHPLSAHYSDQTKLWQDGLSICLSEPFQMGSNDRCLLLKPC